jgi:hypothetical protein
MSSSSPNQGQGQGQGASQSAAGQAGQQAQQGSSGGGSGYQGNSNGGGGPNRPRGPVGDPVLEMRHKDLEEALHGQGRLIGRRAFNWNGVNETTVTFKSIAKLLDAEVPDHPTSDRPPKASGTKAAGS